MFHLNQNFRALVKALNPLTCTWYQESHTYNEADLTLVPLRFMQRTYVPVSFNIPVNNMKLWYFSLTRGKVMNYLGLVLPERGEATAGEEMKYIGG